jgi:hypothetical protein
MKPHYSGLNFARKKPGTKKGRAALKQPGVDGDKHLVQLVNSGQTSIGLEFQPELYLSLPV